MPTSTRTARKTKKPQYDTPWKIALEHHFQDFMAFYFPQAHAKIDWMVPHEFLDKELQAITKHALVGTRHVDKLVKVQRLSGQEDRIFIHIEVQVAREKKFAQRMFTYHYRLFDRYQRPIASMALLGDNDPNWMPQEFGYEALGCEIGFRYPVAKLVSFAAQQAALESNTNPFALVTLAYLHTRATATDMDRRYQVKCSLIRMLFQHQWPREQIRQFFSIIDWMMTLPSELEAKLDEFVVELEEEQKMEYVTSIERVRLARIKQEGKQEGRQEGRQEGKQEGQSELLLRLLTRRFGNLVASVQERIQTASQVQIKAWFDCAIDASTLDDVFKDTAH
jgi:hypothetical protein